MEQAAADPKPAYVAMHWQGINPQTGRWSSEALRQAARYLVEETGATVVPTMRAPAKQLAAAAQRFAVVGPRASKVATLLVSDASDA
jgi:hypothetical protein